MQFKDYYQILGLTKSASQDEIKAAFRKLARKYHPDVSKEPDAAQRMTEVNEANAVLGDPEKRAAYDTVGAQAWAQGARSGDDVRPPPGWNAGYQPAGAGDGDPFASARQSGQRGYRSVDPNSPEFSEFFEQMFGRAGRAQGDGPLRGEDQHVRVELHLTDAYHGSERTITLRAPRRDEQGRVAYDERTLKVNIPKGVKPGQMIRLAGQGSPGYGGGAAGDLYLEVSFAADPRWQVDGVDVTQKLAVAPWEAALGGRVEVAVPDGATLSVNVPPGSGAGNKLRLKGRGIPSAGGAGELYLELQIAMPAAVTEAQKSAWSALAAAYPGFNPRQM